METETITVTVSIHDQPRLLVEVQRLCDLAESAILDGSMALARHYFRTARKRIRKAIAVSWR